MYYTGDGVELDNKEAAKWFRKAARQGDVDAQFLLARMYFEGEGVQQDFVKAYSWFHLSAANGNTIAADHRNRIGKIITKEQRAEGQKLSKRLIKDSARQPAPL
jgi:TPR repeat protein